jgi:hypothetical protein
VPFPPVLSTSSSHLLFQLALHPPPPQLAEDNAAQIFLARILAKVKRFLNRSPVSIYSSLVTIALENNEGTVAAQYSGIVVFHHSILFII